MGIYLLVRSVEQESAPLIITCGGVKNYFQITSNSVQILRSSCREVSKFEFLTLFVA